jgi:hypothetical protein
MPETCIHKIICFERPDSPVYIARRTPRCRQELFAASSRMYGYGRNDYNGAGVNMWDVPTGFRYLNSEWVGSEETTLDLVLPGNMSKLGMNTRDLPVTDDAKLIWVICNASH